jgi:hypothetical protein
VIQTQTQVKASADAIIDDVKARDLPPFKFIRLHYPPSLHGGGHLTLKYQASQLISLLKLQVHKKIMSKHAASQEDMEQLLLYHIYFGEDESHIDTDMDSEIFRFCADENMKLHSRLEDYASTHAHKWTDKTSLHLFMQLPAKYQPTSTPTEIAPVPPTVAAEEQPVPANPFAAPPSEPAPEPPVPAPANPFAAPVPAPASSNPFSPEPPPEEEESESEYEEIEAKVFECDGKQYLLDPQSGSVFQVDGENDYVGKVMADLATIDFTADEESPPQHDASMFV